MQLKNVRGESQEIITVVNKQFSLDIMSAISKPNQIQLFAWKILSNICQKMEHTIPQQSKEMELMLNWFQDNATVLDCIIVPYQLYCTGIDCEQQSGSDDIIINYVSNGAMNLDNNIEIDFAERYLKLLKHIIQLLIATYKDVCSNLLSIENLQMLSSHTKLLTWIASSLFISSEMLITGELIQSKILKFKEVHGLLEKYLIFNNLNGKW